MTGCLRHSHRRGAGLTTQLRSAFPLNLTGGAEGAGLPFVRFFFFFFNGYIYYCSHSSELFWIDVYRHTTRSCVTSRFHAYTPECQCLHPL